MIKALFYMFLIALYTAPALACIGENGTNTKIETLSFTGEVKSRGTFKHQIDFMWPETYFWLIPNDSGWTMLIGPKGETPDYIYPVNPPYRFNPLQNLDGSYGQKTLENSPRKFYFLTSETSFKTASNVLEKLLWPKNEKDQEMASSALETLQRGEGIITLLEGDLDKPVHSDEDLNTERVTRLKFSVELKVPVSYKCAVAK